MNSIGRSVSNERALTDSESISNISPSSERHPHVCLHICVLALPIAVALQKVAGRTETVSRDTDKQT